MNLISVVFGARDCPKYTLPVKNSLLNASVSIPASPMKVTWSLLTGEAFFCLCH